ncbi:hypothetical protein [Streptacidiphilus sp. EB129]|uniref:hypothetical protein n=1 Tax=Streptacidiphilus sp. EB129 TaxID=3156262 RepID=UPI0035165036
MSDSGIYADHGDLTAAMTRLASVSDHLKHTADDFRDAVYVPGEPGDPYSDSLRGWLEPALTQTVEGAEGMGSTVSDTRTAIEITRDSYHAADRAAGA